MLLQGTLHNIKFPQYVEINAKVKKQFKIPFIDLKSVTHRRFPDQIFRKF